MDVSEGTTIGAVAFAILSGAYGAFQQKKASKATDQAITATKVATAATDESLVKSQSDLLLSFKSMADDWKARYEIEHTEFVKYREAAHKKSNEDNQRVLVLTEENADLKARTDLTPVVEQLKEQAESNKQLGVTLKDLSEGVSHLIKQISKLDQIEKQKPT